MTDMTEAVEAVIKTDGLGRMRTPAAGRETLLDEFEHSGINATKFAALAGIKYQTFAGWVLRRHRQRGSAAKSGAACADTVMLPGGARVEISDVKQMALAAALLRSLEKSC